MVIESFVNPVKAEKKPWNLFFIGFLYASAAVFLSLWIFKQYSSLVMVTLTVVASLPLMYRMLKHEERVDTIVDKESMILRHHAKTLSYLLFMFIGFLAGFTLWYLVLPADMVQILFKTQMDTIVSINTRVSGNATDPLANIFSIIFLNNVKVLMFSIFLAFFYGAGAIFVLAWNATVISAAMGTFIKDAIADYVVKFGGLNLFNYFNVVSVGFFRYAIHGIPEIGAYFIGAIAGGIISVAMINHDLETDKFKNIMLDSLDLIMLAVVVLFIAAITEVYVTYPLFS